LVVATFATLASCGGDAVLSPTCFTALVAGAFAIAGAGTLLADGGDAFPICAWEVADADEASSYSHAEPIVGARPNKASAVPIKNLFMDHLLSQWTES